VGQGIYAGMVPAPLTGYELILTLRIIPKEEIPLCTFTLSCAQ
jgi:hypothetical protein